MFSQVPSIDSTCFFRVRRVYRGWIFFSSALILCIPAYLGIKGDQFFSDRDFFWRSINVQICVLQFVSRVQFYAKLNVTNLYGISLY
jgi:hypothetical protein